MTFPVPPASTLGDSERLARRKPGSSPSLVAALLILRMYVYKQTKQSRKLQRRSAPPLAPRLRALDLAALGSPRQGTAWFPSELQCCRRLLSHCRCSPQRRWCSPGTPSTRARPRPRPPTQRQPAQVSPLSLCHFPPRVPCPCSSRCSSRSSSACPPHRRPGNEGYAVSSW